MCDLCNTDVCVSLFGGCVWFICVCVDWFCDWLCVLTGFVTGCVSDCVVVAGFVVQLLEHKDYIVRKLASTLLAKLESEQLVLWVPALLTLLKHPEEKVQAGACEVPSLASGCVGDHACSCLCVALASFVCVLPLSSFLCEVEFCLSLSFHVCETMRLTCSWICLALLYAHLALLYFSVRSSGSV